MWLSNGERLGLRGGRSYGRGRRRAPPRVAYEPFDVPRVAGRKLRRPCASSDLLLGGLAPLQRGLGPLREGRHEPRVVLARGLLLREALVLPRAHGLVPLRLGLAPLPRQPVGLQLFRLAPARLI